MHVHIYFFYIHTYLHIYMMVQTQNFTIHLSYVGNGVFHRGLSSDPWSMRWK